MPIPGEGRRKVFVSYSHNDGDWLKRLQIHLKLLERRGLVELWDDTKIRSGNEWRIESAPEGLRKRAEALSKAVDGLLLALDQAATFIEKTPSTLEEYQTLYQSERRGLLNRRGRLAEDHASVTVTFSLAFAVILRTNSVLPRV